jgi:uncharacterized protein (DUF488 family)
MAPPALWTIGHSTHPLDAFVGLLARHEIGLLADVRTVPRSRRHPHFQTEALADALPERGVAYRHLPRLGGWRRAAPDSPNGAWRNASFRGYADHALGDEFAAGFAELLGLAAERRTAIMCSEALWWRCHRRLVADRAVAAGVRVLHIDSGGGAAEHRLAGFAEVRDDGRVVYPERPSTGAQPDSG